MKNARTTRGSNLLPFLLGAGFAVGIGIAVPSIIWMIQTCGADTVSKSLLGTGAPACVEFWLNRYQSLFAGTLAIIAALVAAVPVWRQLQQSKHQINQQQLQIIRQRLYELNEEESALTSAMSFLEKIKETTERVLSVPLSPISLRQWETHLVSTLSDFNERVREFARLSGRVWGTDEIQLTQIDIGTNLYGAAATYNDFVTLTQELGGSASPIQLSVEEQDRLSEAGKQLSAVIAALQRLHQHYADSVYVVSARLSSQVSELEEMVFN